MAKVKTPLLSLEAHGTIGNALTHQRRSGVDFVRTKPTPTNPNSLPQQYQRWLYQDYAYLWTQASQPTRQTYATAGVRFHLTGFQYWMKYQLANLPDIVAMYHLDNISGGQTLDSSRNERTASVIGCYTTPFTIGNGFFFDKINDYVNCGTLNLAEIVNNITILSYFRSTGVGDRCLYSNVDGSISTGIFMVHGQTGDNRLRIYYNSEGFVWYRLRENVALNEDHFCAFSFDGNKLQFWVDDLPKLSSTAKQPYVYRTINFHIGRRADLGTIHYGGLQDHLVIYNRVLGDAEIARHASRRYSL